MENNLIRQFEEVKAKKAGAFERFLEEIQRRVFSFSSKVCSNAEDAKDALQETLTTAFRSLPEADFADEKALNVWLYKVAKNACLMMRRKGKYEPERELSLDEFLPAERGLQSDWSEVPEQEALRKETREKIRQAVKALPSKHRMVLVLRDMEERSTSETAEILGISELNVKTRLHRARLFLRRELEDYFLGNKKKPAVQVGSRPLLCREAFEHLSEFIDGELDPDTCRCVQDHIQDCKPCVAFLRTLQKSVHFCKQAGTGAAPALEAREKKQLEAILLAWLNREA